MVCGICGEAATAKNAVFSCDSCKERYCKQCAKLTASEVKVMELKETRILKFHCDKCKKFETHTLLQNAIEDKVKIIEAKEEIINFLRQKINELESSKSENPMLLSYSEAAQSNIIFPKINGNLPSIIIKPKQKQNFTKTETDIKKTITPTDLKIAIKNTRSTKDGGLVIKCSSRNDIEILKREAENKLKDYDVQTTKMSWPRFKIAGFSEEISEQQIAKSIMEQNEIMESEDNLKITYVKKFKNGTSIVFGECSPNIFRKLMTLKKVYINWQRYPVYEDISIIRCFKCQQHYHKQDACQNKESCEHCSEEHHIKDCSKILKKCSNCIRANNNYKTTHKVDHMATDPECPSYKYLLNIKRGKIDYGYTNGL